MFVVARSGEVGFGAAMLGWKETFSESRGRESVEREMWYWFFGVEKQLKVRMDVQMVRRREGR